MNGEIVYLASVSVTVFFFIAESFVLSQRFLEF